MMQGTQMLLVGNLSYSRNELTRLNCLYKRSALTLSWQFSFPLFTSWAESAPHSAVMVSKKKLQIGGHFVWMFWYLFSFVVCLYSFLPEKSGYFGTLSVYQESVMKLPVSETSPKRVAMTAAATELPPPTRAQHLLGLRQRPSLVVLALAPVLLARGQGGSSWEEAEKQDTQGSLFDTCQP